MMMGVCQVNSLNGYNVSGSKSKELHVQWFDTVQISLMSLQILRQVYIYINFEEYPHCPWQKALMLGVFWATLLTFQCANYVDKYVQLSKLQ